MNLIVISALLLAFIIYIAVGLILGKRTKGVADMLPLSLSMQARVKNSTEFSASTVATTISLATVVMAFFEISSHFGLWLFWTVITTSMGLLVVRLFAKKIWQRMSVYDHRPTLHEFLAKEYSCEKLSYVGAICTSMGFLFAFATELIVGSMFFAGLVPAVPRWIIVILLSTVAFTYTAIGGFRAVIVTDRLQMISIWLLLLVLPLFYIVYAVNNGGISYNIDKIPAGILTLNYKEGLWAFLIGIFVINVPTYISDMSIWQRIAGAQETKTVMGGLWKSVFSAAVTWGIIALLACFAYMIIEPQQQVNPLVALMNAINKDGSLLAKLTLFVATLGLYGAMLSTASTQLIAVSHTLYEDVFSHSRKQSLKERIASKKELAFSRIILVFSAILSTIIVQILLINDFTIKDLVFAIFGAQLGLCPLLLAALTMKREKLKKLAGWTVWALLAGFIIGWATAIYGHIINNESMTYLPPVSSLVISSLLMFIGMLIHGREKQ